MRPRASRQRNMSSACAAMGSTRANVRMTRVNICFSLLREGPWGPRDKRYSRDAFVVHHRCRALRCGITQGYCDFTIDRARHPKILNVQYVAVGSAQASRARGAVAEAP